MLPRSAAPSAPQDKHGQALVIVEHISAGDTKGAISLIEKCCPKILEDAALDFYLRAQQLIEEMHTSDGNKAELAKVLIFPSGSCARPRPLTVPHLLL